MPLTTAIFIGRSGCGKGTQAKLVSDQLVANGINAVDIMNVSSGDLFRAFIKEGGYTQDKAKFIIDAGERQPDFLAVRLWGGYFIDHYRPGLHLLLDGMPRSHAEARMLETALRFYERNPIDVVHLKVSNEWSINRLKDRKRSDDVSVDSIKHRLAFYEDDVLLAIDYYRGSPYVRFHEVNGEQSIENVHKEVKASLSL
jgi:adenylate kinase